MLLGDVAAASADVTATSSRLAKVARIADLLALFELVAADGLSALNSQQFHLVDSKHGVYEFIAGRLRVLFFKGKSGQLVICTHLFMKKSQKTPDDEKEKAVKLKKRYEKEDAD